jgi:hypothetical protein
MHGVEACLIMAGKNSRSFLWILWQNSSNLFDTHQRLVALFRPTFSGIGSTYFLVSLYDRGLSKNFFLKLNQPTG